MDSVRRTWPNTFSHSLYRWHLFNQYVSLLFINPHSRGSNIRTASGHFDITYKDTLTLLLSGSLSRPSPTGSWTAGIAAVKVARAMSGIAGLSFIGVLYI